MQKSYLSRKENIILTAIEIIDELGIQELSIREISKRQNISEAALYRHFKSKQEIILGVLEYYSQYDKVIIKTIENKQMKAKDGIRFFMKSYSEYYENYPALTAILSTYEIFRYDAEAEQMLKNIIKTRYDAIIALTQEGIIQGEFKTGIISDDFADILFGLIRSVATRWRMSNCSFSLKEKLMRTTESLLEIC